MRLISSLFYNILSVNIEIFDILHPWPAHLPSLNLQASSLSASCHYSGAQSLISNTKEPFPVRPVNWCHWLDIQVVEARNKTQPLGGFLPGHLKLPYSEARSVNISLDFSMASTSPNNKGTGLYQTQMKTEKTRTCSHSKVYWSTVPLVILS